MKRISRSSQSTRQTHASWSSVREVGKVGDMHLCWRLVHVPDRGVLEQAVSMVIENAQKGASCQLPGAISEGKIEAGNMAVAAVAQTWVLRSLRGMSGEEGAKVPVSRAESTVLGTLGVMSGSEGGRI